MKYIRTKDGRIIDTATLPPLVKEAEYDGEGIGEYHGIPIVAEADTIEELCDEFVEISPYNSLHLFYSTFNEAKTMNHCGYVFGMNWVFDKNNIPTPKAVAKINVTGELELL